MIIEFPSLERALMERVARLGFTWAKSSTSPERVRKKASRKKATSGLLRGGGR
jgi:hypothetical protein